MWQRFTERARRIVFFAQEEAGRLGENYVSTEHLLLGLVRENDSVAARILGRLNISLGSIRSEIEWQVVQGDGRLGQDMQLTPRAKRVVDLAYDEARQLNNNYIGTEHLLLGLIREGEGLAGRVLNKLGVDLERTRQEVILLQDSEPGTQGSDITGKSSDAVDLERVRALVIELQNALQPVSEQKTPITWRDFTEQAQRIIAQAKAEIRRLGGNDLLPEHLLIALTRDEGCIGTNLLVRSGVSLDHICTKIEEQMPPVFRSLESELQIHERTRSIFQIAQIEAQHLKNKYIGTEHLILSLIRDNGIAGSLLRNLNVDPSRVRKLLAQSKSPLPDQDEESSRSDKTIPPVRESTEIEAIKRQQSQYRYVRTQKPVYRYSDYAKRAESLASEAASRLDARSVTPEHFLLAVLHFDDSAATLLLQHFGVSPEIVRAEIEQRAEPSLRPAGVRMELMYRSLTMMDHAKYFVTELKSDVFGTEHYLLAILEEGGSAAKILKDLGVDSERLLNEAKQLEEKEPVSPIEPVQPTEPPQPDESHLPIGSPFPAIEMLSGRLTERARHVLSLAWEEAWGFGESYISTEHFLLGLLRENDTVATTVIDRLGFSPDAIRSEIEQRLTRGEGKNRQDFQLTTQAWKVLVFSRNEARRLNNQFIGTEHLLLGLICEPQGLAGHTLLQLGFTLEDTRRTIAEYQDSLPRTEEQTVSEPAEKREKTRLPYTEYVRRSVRFGSIEAARLDTPYFALEHLLLGAMHYEDSAAARILDRLGVTLEKLRSEIAQRTEPDLDSPVEALQKAVEWPRRVFRHAAEAADQFNSAAIGTEHLLLAILREEGVAREILNTAGVDRERVRAEISRLEAPDPANPADENQDREAI